MGDSLLPVPQCRFPANRTPTWVHKQDQINRLTPEIEVGESSQVVDSNLLIKFSVDVVTK
jgi:hypothetical protein